MTQDELNQIVGYLRILKKDNEWRRNGNMHDLNWMFDLQQSINAVEKEISK